MDNVTVNPLFKKVFLLLGALALLSCLASASAAAEVSGYRPVYRPFYEDGRLKIAIREFEKDGKKEALILDPYAFETYPAPLPYYAGDLSKAVKEAEASPFKKALERYTAPPAAIENHGITSAETPVKGVFVTVDMCPSGRPFDRALYERTAELGGGGGKGAPIAVAISGSWIKAHEKEFNRLLEMERLNKLSITWINHSLTHPYKKGAPNDKNFLLAKGVDFEKEALENEILMLERGISPSPFFRFPGLIADDSLMEKLKKLSLIPIGTNAWLGKGEDPKAGSIILVHGNGNEPAGVKTLLRFYHKNTARIKDGDLKLLPLKDAFGR